MDTNADYLNDATNQTTDQLGTEASMLEQVDPMRVHQERVLKSLQREYVDHISDTDNLISHHPLYKPANQCVI